MTDPESRRRVDDCRTLRLTRGCTSAMRSCRRMRGDEELRQFVEKAARARGHRGTLSGDAIDTQRPRFLVDEDRRRSSAAK